MASVKYIETTSTAINGIEKKFGQVLVCTDNNSMYYDNSDGTRILLNGIEVKDGIQFDQTLENNKLYISNGKLYIAGSEIFDGNNIKYTVNVSPNDTKNMIFYLGKRTKVGITPIIMSISKPFFFEDVRISCTVPGTTNDTKINILSCKDMEIRETSIWTAINSTPLIIKPGEYTTFESAMTGDIGISNDADGKPVYFKIEVLEADKNIQGITINMNLFINGFKEIVVPS